MRKVIITSVLVLFVLSVYGQNTVHDYVKRYQKVAINEMDRSGIPASIILAQGILTSTFGNSKLALFANNHFSIKCSDYWNGDFYYKWAEEQKPSCFKVYENPEDSYYEHIDQMMQDIRINNLFVNGVSEYKRWAKGLEKSGFSAVDEYAKELIKVIEEFKLYEYDEKKATDKKLINKPIPTNYDAVSAEFVKNNGVKAIRAKANDTPLGIAIRYNIPVDKLKKYNDLVNDNPFPQHQFVYLKPKKNKWKTDDKDFHIVRGWESVHAISQQYGIKLKALRKLNLLENDEEVMNGERLNLRKTATTKPNLRPADFVKPTTPQKPKITKPIPPKPQREISNHIPGKDRSSETSNNQPPQGEIIPSGKPKITHTTHSSTFKPKPKPTTTAPGTDSKEWFKPKPKPTSSNPNVIASELLKPTETVTQPVPATPIKKIDTTGKIVHVVQKGDTLYRLSKQYNTTVENIQSWNDMINYVIEIGQELVVGESAE